LWHSGSLSRSSWPRRRSRFCSSTLAWVGDRPLYLTGEETATSGHLGSSIVMDPETGMWRETRHFGLLQHENVLPIRLAKMRLPDDGRRLPARAAGVPVRLHRRQLQQGASGHRRQPVRLEGEQPGQDRQRRGREERERAGPLRPDQPSGERDARHAEGRRDRPRSVQVRPPRGRRAAAGQGRSDLHRRHGQGAATSRGRIYQFDISRSDPTPRDAANDPQRGSARQRRHREPGQPGRLRARARDPGGSRVGLPGQPEPRARLRLPLEDGDDGRPASSRPTSRRRSRGSPPG